jgi:polyhydroxyalkanoate synthesis regulator phasin
VDAIGSAATADPTMKLLEAMQASQTADAKAFQLLMEKKIATMNALRAMQQNDAKSLAQIEELLRQTRSAMAPVAPPAKTQEAVKPVEENTSSAKQVESLTRLIDRLDREVKQISHKVDQLQK